ncbi:MAG: LysE family translocator [Acidobacteriota bacterium]
MNVDPTFFVSGTVLGLAAGCSPGPLTTLVITETLRHKLSGGVKIAISPLITDLPIILATLLVLSQFTDVKPVLGIISFAGAALVGYFAYESFTTRETEASAPSQERPRSIRKGVAANFLNPNPYMFWMSVGSPILLKAIHSDGLSAALFLVSFYICIVGSKIAIALLVARFSTFLKSRFYLYTLRTLGTALAVFALIFIKNGLELFGLLPA